MIGRHCFIDENGDLMEAWISDGLEDTIMAESLESMEKIYQEREKIIEAGKKNDAGKPMWELLPYDALEGAVKILTFGATKYGNRNWEKGISYGRLFGALMRHLWTWWMCKVRKETGLDAESGQSHLDHALCELLFLIAHDKRNMEKFDDRPMSPRA